VTSLVEPMTTDPSHVATGEPLIELRGLTVDYGAGKRRVRAVDGIDLTIRAGEVVGLAGESGCGKTTVANAVMQILRAPAQITSGSISFRGEDLVGKRRDELRRYRWRNVSMVFQSAMNALNPVMRVGDQFVDMMLAHERISKRASLASAGELLELVGIDRRRVRAYPHELSGGMRQRVNIARALATDPQLLLLDEPFAALDAQTREFMQVELLKILARAGKTALFVTHQIDEAIFLAHRVAVFSARPARIKEIIVIDLPPQRSLELKFQPRFRELQDHIWRLIYEESASGGMAMAG